MSRTARRLRVLERLGDGVGLRLGDRARGDERARASWIHCERSGLAAGVVVSVLPLAAVVGGVVVVLSVPPLCALERAGTPSASPAAPPPTSPTVNPSAVRRFFIERPFESVDVMRVITAWWTGLSPTRRRG
jgi:hypothetical protein